MVLLGVALLAVAVLVVWAMHPQRQEEEEWK